MADNNVVQPIPFGSALSIGGITVYGQPLEGIAIAPDQVQAQGLTNAAGLEPIFAQIHAWRVGTYRCVTLPTPIILLVFGAGTPLREPECGFQSGEALKWTFPIDASTLSLESSRGPVDDLLEAAATRGVDGGISFDNPRYSNGKLYADVHIWAEISVFGSSVDFDERFPVSIRINEPCYTVWENGWANLKVCYRAPNQICVKLCVGKWGYEKCWDECVSIPLPAAIQQSPSAPLPCCCAKDEAES